MAQSGELISINNLGYDWVTNEKTIHEGSLGRNGTLSNTYYIAAPVFRIYYKINHTGLGSSVGWFAAYKWTGVNYQNYFDSTPVFTQNPQKGIGSGPTEFVFSHNWNEGTNNESDIHLWKIVASWGSDDSWFSGTEYKLTFRLGSVGVSTQPHMYQRGSKIYCSPCYYDRKNSTTVDGTVIDDSTFIVIAKPSSFRGGLINEYNARGAYSVKEN